MKKMKILFIFYIPDFKYLHVLFCTLNSILDINLLYVLLTTIIIFSGLSVIKHSKVVQAIKNGGKVIAAGGAAKGGSDAYDLTKEYLKEKFEEMKKKKSNSSNNGNSNIPNPSGNSNTSNSSNSNSNANK